MFQFTVHVHLSSSFIKILASKDTIQAAVLGHHRGKRAAPKTGSSKLNKFQQLRSHLSPCDSIYETFTFILNICLV